VRKHRNKFDGALFNKSQEMGLRSREESPDGISRDLLFGCNGTVDIHQLVEV
jgi:hypothetical protein